MGIVIVNLNLENRVSACQTARQRDIASPLAKDSSAALAYPDTHSTHILKHLTTPFQSLTSTSRELQ